MGADGTGVPVLPPMGPIPVVPKSPSPQAELPFLKGIEARWKFKRWNEGWTRTLNLDHLDVWEVFRNSRIWGKGGENLQLMSVLDCFLHPFWVRSGMVSSWVCQH